MIRKQRGRLEEDDGKKKSDSAAACVVLVKTWEKGGKLIDDAKYNLDATGSIILEFGLCNLRAKIPRNKLE